MNQEEKEMAEELFNTASIVLAEQGELSPIYFIVKDKMMNPMVGGPEITIQNLANTAVNIAHEWNAEAIVLICEQWMVEMHKDSEEIKEYMDGNKRPSESPDAEAYLTLTYMSKDGKASSLVAKIHTSLNGIRHVKDNKWIDDTVTNMITPWV